MKQPTKIVISASRRTDIPAFYMDWFMERIKRGFFEVTNPYNTHTLTVPATSEKVHTIVFWSKNFGYFLKESFGEKLKNRGFNLFFNFTINSELNFLEPNVGALQKRIAQLKELAFNFGTECITWRFDPICFYSNQSRQIKNNLKDFVQIAKKASKFGLCRCVTSFFDDYPKIRKRLAKMSGFSFVEISIEKKRDILLRMERKLSDYNIQLFVCCEKKIMNILPAYSTIDKSSCIPSDFLQKIFGGNLSLKKDSGQRVKAGCGCMVSSDIGSYKMHPCFHNCLFCYANPSPGHY